MRSCSLLTVLWLMVLGSGAVVRGDGPADNLPDKVRRIPKLGIELTDAQHKQFSGPLAELQQAVEQLRKRTDERTRSLLPDVEIYYRAARDAITYQEIFSDKDLPNVQSALETGLARARDLLAGQAPWTTQTGLVVRGYVSKIDGSVQPYGLVVPDTYAFSGAHQHRLDLWFHGRGETLSEVNFINDRTRNRGQFAPPDTIVLHPYGRYSNAFKFAGEVDVLEALDSVRQRYRIDEDRIAVRGFSMGGAACWQFAVHYPDRWVGATPGAGFSETPEFLRVFQNETLSPTWYERKLWHLYDCTDYAVNLTHCPTIAYSGEKDSQKQAADIMATALQAEGIDLLHLIGPGQGHSYDAASRVEIDRRLNDIAARGRQRLPARVNFTTYTLKYNRLHWVTIDALGEHWERAKVQAALLEDSNIGIATENVTALTLSIPAGWCPFELTEDVLITIDGDELTGPRPTSDKAWQCRLQKSHKGWTVVAPALAGQPDSAAGLRKRHDLQGPIDDAFMDSFIFVRPTGKCRHSATQEWVNSELDRAIEHWRRHFRGEARVKDDTAITEADIASANLVLWGDTASNAVLAKIAKDLPIQWSEAEIVVGDRKFAAEHHVPVLVYPNPLNPRRYVVLNSSFTYRDYAYLNNARQVPMLPDWAIVDLRTPPGSQYPGKIAAADFFGEAWEVRPPREE